MKFQDIVSRLFESEDFQSFKEEKPDAFPCSGFFSIDVNEKDNKQHIDYFVPSENKVYSFKLEAGGERVPTEFQDDKKPEKVSLNHEFNFNEMKDLVTNAMSEKGMKNQIQKYLFSFQHSPETGRDYLLGTIFISGLALLKIKINLEKKKIESFEKKSFMQMMNVFKKGGKKEKGESKADSEQGKEIQKQPEEDSSNEQKQDSKVSSQ